MELLLNFSPAVVVALNRGAGSLALRSSALFAKTQTAKMALAATISRRLSSERNRADRTGNVPIMRENLIPQQTFGNLRRLGGSRPAEIPGGVFFGFPKMKQKRNVRDEQTIRELFFANSIEAPS